MSHPFDDIFDMFCKATSSGHTERDLSILLDHLATPPEERLRRILERCWEMGWDAHYAELEEQRNNPSHPITNTNPWRKTR